MNEEPVPYASSPETTALVAGNTAFAVDLYQKLKGDPGNLFFSPYSISTALAMAHAGARNQTEKEMADTLHFTLPEPGLDAAFGDLAARMNRIQRWHRITLTVANSLWYQADYHIAHPYLHVMRTRYNGSARAVDFVRSATEAGNQIDEWVEGKTKGKIKDANSAGQLDPDTRLVLCNAVYFKGAWQTQFKKADTQPGPFIIRSNQTVTVPMMTEKAEVKMARDAHGAVEMVELPYVGNDLSMVILLPGPKQIDLPGLERALTSQNLGAWLDELDAATPDEIWVSLPRFTAAQSFDLSKTLSALGMPSAFGRSADFSGMDGTAGLFLSHVNHEAFVEVNETGTEAAAATEVEFQTLDEPERFIANHPFIFLIRDNGSGTILFLGRMVDPTQTGFNP